MKKSAWSFCTGKIADELGDGKPEEGGAGRVE